MSFVSWTPSPLTAILTRSSFLFGLDLESKVFNSYYRRHFLQFDSTVRNGSINPANLSKEGIMGALVWVRARHFLPLVVDDVNKFWESMLAGTGQIHDNK